MSSIASTSMMSGCSMLIKTVIFLFGSVSAAGATSVAENVQRYNVMWANSLQFWVFYSYVEPQSCLLVELVLVRPLNLEAQLQIVLFSIRIPRIKSSRNLTLSGWQTFHLVSCVQQCRPLSLMIVASEMRSQTAGFRLMKRFPFFSWTYFKMDWNFIFSISC